MSSLLSDDDESLEEEEEEEDSTFHREIILQDNYSDEEESYCQGDTEAQESASQQHAGNTGKDERNPRQASASLNGDRHVTFAPECNDLAANFEAVGGGGPKQAGFVMPKNVTFSGFYPTAASPETVKQSLLSTLPSSILGNTSAMSKYLTEYLSGHQELEQKMRTIQDPVKRKEAGEEIFPEKVLTNKFRSLDNTQVAIEDAYRVAAKYAYPPGALIQLMHDVFISMPTSSSITRIGIFYVYNHLIHKFGKSSWKHPISFVEVGLKRFCIPAIMHSNKIKCANAVHIVTCINVWRQRKLYSAAVCDQLESLVTCELPRGGATQQKKNSTCVYTVNNEVGSVKKLRYILKMPLVDESFEEAAKGIDHASITDTNAPNRASVIADAKEKGKYPLFQRSNQLSGQELIILHSSYLDLAALIEEGDKQLKLVKREIKSLNKAIESMST